MKNQKTTVAFTLAEVLITLGVIGIVAAMTIPTIKKRIEIIQLQTALKKMSSTVNQAVNKLGIDSSGDLSGLCTSGDDACFLTALQKHIRSAKTCAVGSMYDNCWVAQTKWYRGNGTVTEGTWQNTFITRYASMVLPDGSYLATAYTGCSPASDSSYNYIRCGVIIVDVNGPKLPNIISKDIFYWHVMTNPIKLLPEGISYNTAYTCNLTTGNGSFRCSYERLQDKGW